ncbi:MAG: hypothetical protein LBV80_07835 [Deltaproteobacteria bacterium]|nr:hypothetical protein [Deltaproteobacteria bacterium]
MSERILSVPASNFNPAPTVYNPREHDERHCCGFCHNLCDDPEGAHCPTMADACREAGYPVAMRQRLYVNSVWRDICPDYDCDEAKFYAETGSNPGEFINLDEYNGVFGIIDFPATLGGRVYA